MDLVKDFCEAVAHPGPERLDGARGQLLEAVQTASRTTAGGAPGTGRTAVSPGHRQPMRTRTRMAIAGGVVVAIVAALIAAQGITIGGRTPLGPPATAAQLLQRAAAASAAQPVPRNYQYIYIEATGVAPASMVPNSTKTVRFTTWTWSSVDGSKRNYTRQRPCQRVPGGPDGLGPLACDSTFGGIASALPPGPGQVPPPGTYAQARKLPANPRQLLAYLARMAGGGDAWSELTLILVNVPVLPPKVAAAVFTVASELPGVTLRPHATDAAGRPGLGVVKAGDPSHNELIFNRGTYQLSGIDTTGDGSGGGPIEPVAGATSTAILHTAVVNSAPIP
jgi:hypothetical protein